MSDQERVEALARLIDAAGQAHHDAIGGADPQWPMWYADQMYPAVLEHVDSNPTVDELAQWLAEADELHRATAPEAPWAKAYADTIIRSHSATA